MRKLFNEQLLTNSTNPIKIRAYDYKNFTYPWHFHTEFEMIYVEKGFGKCMIGDNSLDFKDQNLFFFGSCLPHWMQSADVYKMDNELRVNGTIIQFEKDFMQYSFSNYSQFLELKDLMNNSMQGLRFDISGNKKLQRLLKSVVNKRGLRQMIGLLEILCEMADIEDFTLASSSHYSFTNLNSDYSKLDKIIHYINSKYTQDISLQTISSLAAMTPSAFCRYFKNCTGKTFKDYVLELRISYASKLLIHDNMNISEIGFECGFDTTSYFNKVFKRFKGCTPTEFKNSIEEK